MKNHDLIRMINQIAGFFEAYPHDEAVRETRNHICAFWEPRMRRQLAAFVHEGGKGLTPIAREAVVGLEKDAA